MMFLKGEIMKDILLITNYWHFENEKASSRYLTLANMISEEGMKLEIVTSSFYHSTKSQRKYTRKFLNSHSYKVTLVEEKGYTHNISFSRLQSHREFANNVISYIHSRKKPDIIYCVVPSIDVAYKVSNYARKNSIKLVVDIQDLLPEALNMVIKVPFIKDILFAPMKYKANKVYSNADKIVAVSQTYVERALKVNKKCNEGQSVFLGTELCKFDSYLNQKNTIIKPTNEIWVAYVGTLGHSYDLETVIKAIKILNNKGINNIKFIVMGDGPLRNKFEKFASELNVSVEFMGSLIYSKMVSMLSMCDIAVNPIIKNSAASIINKHADYLAAGLPIINSQESLEFRGLLLKYDAGFNSRNNDPIDFSEKLLKLSENLDLRKKMGENSRKLAEEKFNRLKTYKKIVNILYEL